MQDEIGDRIKSKYEDPFRIVLPQRCYTVIRIDGKAFHTFTRKLPKPYCSKLAAALDQAAMVLCKEGMGYRFAFGQSDEYSFLLTDFAMPQTEMWFGGNIQKMASVSASIFTAAFNQAWQADMDPAGDISRIGTFDSRVFIIPNRADVENYFIWRQQDATRNSINMLASCYYSHNELMGKGSSDKHELLHQKGVNWNDYATAFKRGRVIRKVVQERTVTFTHKKTGKSIEKEIEESAWTVDGEIPVFTQDREYSGDTKVKCHNRIRSAHEVRGRGQRVVREPPTGRIRQDSVDSARKTSYR